MALIADDVMREVRNRCVNYAIDQIAAEREWLKDGAGSSIRTLRLMAFRTIRRHQRQLARIADELIAEAR